MNWGKWIILSFVLFAAFIATLVTVCVRQDISLVSKDYYKDELVYQEQIERIKNTGLLRSKPVISIIDKKVIRIDFDQFKQLEKGELKLFCPSNASFDRKFEILPTTENSQVFPLDRVQKGMYRARMLWSMHGEGFYFEEVINI